MIKLINVVAGLVVALTFATEVSAGDIKHSAPSESGVQASTGSGKVRLFGVCRQWCRDF
jgi:hypothetical protein